MLTRREDNIFAFMYQKNSYVPLNSQPPQRKLNLNKAHTVSTVPKAAKTINNRHSFNKTSNTMAYHNKKQPNTTKIGPHIPPGEKSSYPAFNLDLNTPHGAWANSVIARGTPTLAVQHSTYHRMMTLTGCATEEEVRMDHVIRYLHGATSTCKYQTLDTYAGQIRQHAIRSDFPWAQDQIWSLLRRGLRCLSTPRQHAKPMETADFQAILNDLPPDIALAATLAYLAGARVDEVFRIVPKAIVFVPADQLAKKLAAKVQSHIFVTIATGKESKTGPTDDEDLRFLDIVLLDKAQTTTLTHLLRTRSKESSIFVGRDKLTRTLAAHGYTDHSFKGGAANLLSRMIRDEELPEEVLPLILKHKTLTNPIGSTTAGYLSTAAKLNIMQCKGTFTAAILLRREIFHDI